MQDDVNITPYESLLAQYNDLFEMSNNLPECSEKPILLNLLAGAEELLIRWDEINTDFSRPVITLLKEVRLILENQYNSKSTV